MKKKLRKVLKWTGITILSLIVLLVCFGFWFMSLIPPKDLTLEATTVHDLPYLSANKIENRRKILAVVTSAHLMGTSKYSTGYELTELARAYYVFKANGFEVDVASPLGGKSPVIIDKDDMGPFDYAFLNDREAQTKTGNTIPIAQIKPKDYQAVFFVGGKGAMFDFPENKTIQNIVQTLYENDKVVGAVCHGPAALVNVTLSDGSMLLKDKTVSGFTNQEELLLIADAREIFPFLLQDKLSAQGARFNQGEMYLENVSTDDKLVTGQNPWSTWKLAETMISAMGYTPKYRAITDEEHAVEILEIYETQGLPKAKQELESKLVSQKPVKRDLIAKHAIVGIMRGEPGRFTDLLSLTRFAKKCEEKQNLVRAKQSKVP